MLLILALSSLPAQALPKKDKEYFKTMIKSEVAGIIWSRNELWSIRTDLDNQVMQALDYFNNDKKFRLYKYRQ